MSQQIVWMDDDEKENIKRYDLSFQKAKEAILNLMSLRIPNIPSRIVMARRANKKESEQFFNKIKGLL